MNFTVATRAPGKELALATACRELVGAKKGGSNARTPVETPDSLRSIARARILDFIAEGELRGLVAGNQSIYLDQVPIQNADGTLNFQGVRVETRSGTQDQTHIAGFPSVENEIAVNVELRSDSPVVRTATGADLSAVRVRLAVPALQKVDTSNGDTVGYSISYAIDLSTNGGPYTTVLSSAFTDKTTTQYERSHRIDLPAGTQWQVRIRRLTPNANSSTISDIVNVLSMTEVIDAKLRYPNCALAAVEVDASQFQNIPARSYRIWGRIVRIPSNYNPQTRAYSGVWDGTFKNGWTNNPAWAFFDIVTNDRFGLGHRIPLDWVDKWRLYQIAQYCDQLVGDGQGNMEPRFTCSLYMQTRADAYRVLQDMGSIFRGISFYAAGQVMASADMPSDPVFTYTQANVIDGRFSYEGTGRKARHTVALVSWTDPDDFGRQKVEPVQYQQGVQRYGIQQTEVTAVGCHSRSQAQRIGNHILYTENLETETVSFGVGLDVLNCLPGDVIQVADPSRAGRRNGGRIRSATADTLVLDKLPEVIAPGDTLRATLPTGRTQARTVQSITGNAVKVTAPWAAVPVAQSIWSLESTELALQQFRVLAITENSITEEQGITYQVTALKHVPGKYAAIDDGTRLELPPISIIPPSVQPPPTNVTLSSHSVIDQGIATHVLTIAWDAPDKAIAYDVEWRRDDMSWVRSGRVSTASIEVRGIYSGNYVARVRAVNALNAVSQPAMSALTAITGKTEPPPALASLTASSGVFSIGLAWGFPIGATDTQRTEIWYGSTPNRAAAIKLGDFAYPQARHQINGLAAGARFYFWGRLVDRSGNIGPWYPAGAGVMGEASSSQTDYDTYFSGRITESALGQGLLQKIDTIDSLEPLLPVLWSAEGVYSYGQTVVRDGRTYSWASSTPGNQQPPGGSWQDVGVGMAGYGALLSQVDQNTQAINVVDGKVTAQGQRITGITAQITPQGAGDGDWGAGDTTVHAGTITIQSVNANANLAQAQRTDQVEVGLGQANAAVKAETNARTTQFSALSSRVDTTNASLAGTNATVQQVSQSVVTLDGKVSSTYTLRAQVTAGGQIYAAGMGLGVEQQPDGSYQSQFLVRADRFAVINIANGQVTTPFVIQGGQTFISQALIGNGWIQNAMIGDVIQSTAVGAGGLPRWKLDKNGSLAMNGPVGGGALSINDQNIFVRAPNGNPLVALGDNI
ncbi:host specificity protein J [Stenotrophomonas rhizophila]|nr:host specificity protein J [Stenotrophomonas rhizophila]